jgi:hypothetical protein
MSCNRHAGYDVREVTPPLAPMLCLLDWEPVPRLEVALRKTQQCQLKVAAMGRSAAG